jgi:glycogen debranching enzyme
LIGSCAKNDEDNIVSKFLSNWNTSVSKYKDQVENYALRNFPLSVGDSIIDQTARWSKAVLGSNIHYLDGKFVPMPCPAEYNFFFTHDALLTNLGAVYFDLERVKKDLLYLKSLTQPDSILPHAYYWKDDRFMTEYCGSDNWNHFWFIILANSYLKHSGDIKTIELIYPIIHKSISLVMRNKLDDDLLYGTQPDWWDIGHVYNPINDKSFTRLCRDIPTVKSYGKCITIPQPSSPDEIKTG